MAIQTRSGSVKGTLYLYKRVPKRYASVEPRTFVWISLHTDSLSVAKTKEAATWEQMIAADSRHQNLQDVTPEIAAGEFSIPLLKPAFKPR